MGWRRAVQSASLLIFLASLAAAAFDLNLGFWPPDVFLRMDPALVGLTAVSARMISLAFLPAAVVLILGPLIGRFFCGWVCPMGTTLDGGGKLFGSRPVKKSDLRGWRSIKYLGLAFLLGAALLGVSFVFTAAPLSLITRFYGLVLLPVLMFLTDGVLNVIRPLGDRLDIPTLTYARILIPRFTTQFFVLALFVSLAALARVAPRFWCRCLCPAGALLALASWRPYIRRSVSAACTGCGLCAGHCPMGAIPLENPKTTCYSECIFCRTCEKVCPVGAVAFSRTRRPIAAASEERPSPRRQFLLTGLAGLGTAAVGLTGLHTLQAKPGEGQVAPPGLLRPPGTRPEADFLSRCVRCGECMVACPTNTLQPVWFAAGPLGMFSPLLTPRRGYCDPHCHRCAQVCPTGAIRRLPDPERLWAKTGTAMVIRQKCLAWEHQKSCMVCDEVCPFDAVEFLLEPGNPVPVPHVIEDRCAGCGYCEHFCPVQNQAAIIVIPMGEIRLAKGSYLTEGRRRGLQLTLKPLESVGPAGEIPVPDQGPAPGFTLDAPPDSGETLSPGGEGAPEPAPGFTR